jgi:hypothetical protein
VGSSVRPESRRGPVNIAITVQMTLRQRLRNIRAQLRWVGWVFRLAGAVFLLFGVLSDTSWLGLAVFYLVFPELIGVVRHLLARKYGPVYTYTLSDDGLRVTTAISDLRFVWTAVKTVRERSDAWVLRLAGAGAVALPKAGFTPEQADEWRAFAERRRVVRT